jgi:hypothetical protein
MTVCLSAIPARLVSHLPRIAERPGRACDRQSGESIEERLEALDMMRFIESVADLLKVFGVSDDSRI